MKYLSIFLLLAAIAFLYACNSDNGVSAQPDANQPHAMNAPAPSASANNDQGVVEDQADQSGDEIVPETAPTAGQETPQSAPLNDGFGNPMPAPAPPPDSQENAAGVCHPNNFVGEKFVVRSAPEHTIVANHALVNCPALHGEVRRNVRGIMEFVGDVVRIAGVRVTYNPGRLPASTRPRVGEALKIIWKPKPRR